MAVNSTISFFYGHFFADNALKNQSLTVLVTNNYTGNVETTFWTDITPANLQESLGLHESRPIPFAGEAQVMSFRFVSSGNQAGETTFVIVGAICVQEGTLLTQSPSLSPAIESGVPSIRPSWASTDAPLLGVPSALPTTTSPVTVVPSQNLSDAPVSSQSAPTRLCCGFRIVDFLPTCLLLALTAKMFY